ncbi:MAG: hypothetical protein NVSMB39_7730 [Candidatus Saccharimonadales bacterium]
MEKQVSLTLGGVLAGLAVAGLTHDKKPKHAMDLMNVDPAHSFIRVPVVGALLYGGAPTTPAKVTRGILSGTGLLYLAIGAAGLFDRQVGGLLPSKLTNFDLVYHLAAGLGLLALGSRRVVKPLLPQKLRPKSEFERYPYVV